jgi:hypothetical protein
MHGGAPGSGAPKGNRNALRHGPTPLRLSQRGATYGPCCAVAASLWSQSSLAVGSHGARRFWLHARQLLSRREPRRSQRPSRSAAPRSIGYWRRGRQLNAACRPQPAGAGLPSPRASKLKAHPHIAMPAATRSPTRATTPGQSRVGSATGRSQAPRSTRPWRRTGSRISGGIEGGLAPPTRRPARRAGA